MKYAIFVINAIFAVMILFFQRKNPRAIWAWLLLLFALPGIGIVIYLLFGTEPVHERSRYTEPRLFEHNKIEIITRGLDKFANLFEDIKNAQTSIDLEYYIIRRDFLSYELISLLKEKASEGVRIRLLYDGMGCLGGSVLGRRNLQWLKNLKQSGIEVSDFFSCSLRQLPLRLNYRNHRKIAVIDNCIGYLGGFNIGREYLGLNKKLGCWRDTHLRITGDAVQGLSEQFDSDWESAANKQFPDIHRSVGTKKPACENGNTKIRLLAGGPDRRVQTIRNHFFRIIVGATHSLDIQTPYFIPDESILCALLCAAQHGVRIRIMIPCKPDHPVVYQATLSYHGELLAAGVECYQYQEGFLHAKGIIADDAVMSFGTANMDVRSFLLNYEINAVIYGREEVGQMREQFERDLLRSVRLTREA